MLAPCWPHTSTSDERNRRRKSALQNGSHHPEQLDARVHCVRQPPSQCLGAFFLSFLLSYLAYYREARCRLSPYTAGRLGVDITVAISSILLEDCTPAEDDLSLLACRFHESICSRVTVSIGIEAGVL